MNPKIANPFSNTPSFSLSITEKGAYPLVLDDGISAVTIEELLFFARENWEILEELFDDGSLISWLPQEAKSLRTFRKRVDQARIRSQLSNEQIEKVENGETIVISTAFLADALIYFDRLALLLTWFGGQVDQWRAISTYPQGIEFVIAKEGQVFGHFAVKFLGKEAALSRFPKMMPRHSILLPQTAHSCSTTFHSSVEVFELKISKNLASKRSFACFLPAFWASIVISVAFVAARLIAVWLALNVVPFLWLLGGAFLTFIGSHVFVELVRTKEYIKKDDMIPVIIMLLIGGGVLLDTLVRWISLDLNGSFNATSSLLFFHGFAAIALAFGIALKKHVPNIAFILMLLAIPMTFFGVNEERSLLQDQRLDETERREDCAPEMIQWTHFPVWGRTHEIDTKPPIDASFRRENEEAILSELEQNGAECSIQFSQGWVSEIICKDSFFRRTKWVYDCQ